MSKRMILRPHTILGLLFLGVVLVGCSLTGLYRTANEEIQGTLEVGHSHPASGTNNVTPESER